MISHKIIYGGNCFDTASTNNYYDPYEKAYPRALFVTNSSDDLQYCFSQIGGMLTSYSCLHPRISKQPQNESNLS